MPVLDLDDFLKKNAAQKDQAQPAQAPPGPAAKDQGQGPFAAFGGRAQQPAEPAAAAEFADFRQKTDAALSGVGQDFLKLSARVLALERNAGAAQAKTEQLIAAIDRIQPDKISAEIADVRSQLSSARPPGAPMQDAGGGVRVSGPDVSGAVRRLETEYIEMSSKLRPMEVALEQLKSWAERDKDYFIKTDEAHNKLAELERKIALKSDFPSEQIMSRAQFEKYSKMADLDRQQLRLSVDSLRDTVSQVSASVDRLNSLAAGGAAAYQAAQQPADLDKYSKELEKTRAEVAANYEQVKAVERLLTAQSNKMQAVFSEIQKNLSEYKLTSDTINSTHDAVLRDISSLKAEHERGIEDYRRIAAELSQKVEQNARAVSEMHLMINGLQYAASQPGAARFAGGEPQDAGAFRSEQRRLLDETNDLSAKVADLSKKAAAFQEQAAKIAHLEEAAARAERAAKGAEANNAAMFANITAGFSELKRRMDGTPGGQAAPDPSRMATVEKGFADLGQKVDSIEQENAALFANLSKSVSKLKAQVDALQTAAPPSHAVSASEDGRVVFAAAAAPQAEGTLLSRIDALEKSISSLKLPPQVSASSPVQFAVTPESIGDSLRLFEARLAYLESFKGELDTWKEKADDISAKVDSLYSSHSQLVQEVASVISEKQSGEFASEQFSTTQAEESKALLNELKVQTELLSSKLAATEGNVSAVVGQRFSQLQTQSDRIAAELSAVRASLPEKVDILAASEARQAAALAQVDARLSQSMEERFSKSQQAAGQQALEFAAFRDVVPEKIRLAVTAAEARQADAVSAVDAKVAKLSAESDKLRDFVAKSVADTEKNAQDSRTALAEMRARSDELATKIAGFSSSQAQFVQDLSGTIEDKFAEAQQSIEKTAEALAQKMAQFEEKQEGATAKFEASQSQMLASFEAKQAEAAAALDKRQADLAAALEVRESQTTGAIAALQAGVASLKAESEKASAAISARMDTVDALSRSASDLVSTTRADVSSEVANARKAQESLSVSMAEGFARSASSIQQLSSSMSETSKGMAALRTAVDERAARQEQELSQVRASNALLEQKVAGMLAALEKVAALARELDAERAEVRDTVRDLRQAFNAQAQAAVEQAQKQLALPQEPPEADAKARQAALEASLSELEKAIAEMDSKMREAPQPLPRPAARQPQQAAPQPQGTAPPRPAGPQQRIVTPPRQEYYAPSGGPEQQAPRAAPIRPIQRPAQRPQQPQYAPTGETEAVAQTEADRQAMELMEELRGKLLGEEAPKPEKKESKQGEEQQDKAA
jgi:chromosome segregation ATPase